MTVTTTTQASAALWWRLFAKVWESMAGAVVGQNSTETFHTHLGLFFDGKLDNLFNAVWESIADSKHADKLLRPPDEVAATMGRNGIMPEKGAFAFVKARIKWVMRDAREAAYFVPKEDGPAKLNIDGHPIDDEGKRIVDAAEPWQMPLDAQDMGRQTVAPDTNRLPQMAADTSHRSKAHKVDVGEGGSFAIDKYGQAPGAGTIHDDAPEEVRSIENLGSKPGPLPDPPRGWVDAINLSPEDPNEIRKLASLHKYETVRSTGGIVPLKRRQLEIRRMSTRFNGMDADGKRIPGQQSPQQMYPKMWLGVWGDSPLIPMLMYITCDDAHGTQTGRDRHGVQHEDPDLCIDLFPAAAGVPGWGGPDDLGGCAGRLRLCTKCGRELQTWVLRDADGYLLPEPKRIAGARKSHRDCSRPDD